MCLAIFIGTRTKKSGSQQAAENGRIEFRVIQRFGAAPFGFSLDFFFLCVVCQKIRKQTSLSVSRAALWLVLVYFIDFFGRSVASKQTVLLCAILATWCGALVAAPMAVVTSHQAAAFRKGPLDPIDQEEGGPTATDRT